MQHRYNLLAGASHGRTTIALVMSMLRQQFEEYYEVSNYLGSHDTELSSRLAKMEGRHGGRSLQNLSLYNNML